MVGGALPELSLCHHSLPVGGSRADETSELWSGALQQRGLLKQGLGRQGTCQLHELRKPNQQRCEADAVAMHRRSGCCISRWRDTSWKILGSYLVALSAS